MVEFRPHILKWSTPAGEPGDDENGYPTPGTPGSVVQMPCRWHLGGNKEYRNEDNGVTMQKGRIRIDKGVELPEVGQEVEVLGHFKGVVKDIYRGQISWRIDV